MIGDRRTLLYGMLGDLQFVAVLFFDRDISNEAADVALAWQDGDELRSGGADDGIYDVKKAHPLIFLTSGNPGSRSSGTKLKVRY